MPPVGPARYSLSAHPPVTGAMTYVPARDAGDDAGQLLEPDRQSVVVEPQLLIGAEERQADAVDEDVARERQRILRHGSDRAAGDPSAPKAPVTAANFGELRVAGDADHADAADELAVGDDAIRRRALVPRMR